MTTTFIATPVLAEDQDSSAANLVKPAQGTTLPAEPNQFHPLGSLPTNEITSRPYVASQTRNDLVFGANAQLRSIADVYAGSDGQRRFVADFARV